MIHGGSFSVLILEHAQQHGGAALRGCRGLTERRNRTSAGNPGRTNERRIERARRQHCAKAKPRRVESAHRSPSGCTQGKAMVSRVSVSLIIICTNGAPLADSACPYART